jgi:hypothetical protein
VLYGILQSQNGEFTDPSLSHLTGTGPNTLKRAVTALAQAAELAQTDVAPRGWAARRMAAHYCGFL